MKENKLDKITLRDDYWKVAYKIGIDISKMTEEQRERFLELSDDFIYGEQIFLLDDKRYNQPPY
jgi:hypothetical protein